MTVEEEDLRGIGISPRERLARIELLLLDISKKLDSKADKADVMSLEARVWEMEVKGSTASIEALAEARRLATERADDLEALKKGFEDLTRKTYWVLGAVAAGAVALGWGLENVPLP